MIVRNRTQGMVLGERVKRADRFWTRLGGLMFRAELSPGAGLWIHPCQAVHTHFMRFPIDVLFVDGEGHVCQVIHAMAPWRHSPIVKRAVAVLELPIGEAGSTTVGDLLECQEIA